LSPYASRGPLESVAGARFWITVAAGADFCSLSRKRTSTAATRRLRPQGYLARADRCLWACPSRRRFDAVRHRV